MDLIRELNYVCNADIFVLAYTMKTNLKSREDRNKVTLWLQKIMKSNKTLLDLKLRNVFLRILTQMVEKKKLDSPFNQEPPRTALKALVRLLLGRDDIPVQEDEDMAMLRFLPAKHGGYLLPKPLPQIGAYCHITATAPGECIGPCGQE